MKLTTQLPRFTRPGHLTVLTALTASLATLCLAPASFGQFTDQFITFGSDNDGLGGFTQNATGPTESWTTNTGDVTYRHEDGGSLNPSFLREFPLIRDTGYAYNVEGTWRMNDGYADDNNRTGFYLFGDVDDIVDEDEIGAIGFMFNTDDGSQDGPPGSNADDTIYLVQGLDNTPLSTTVQRDQTDTPYSQDLFGTSVTFSVDIAFRNGAFTDALNGGAATGDYIEITGFFVDLDNTTSTGTIEVGAADFTGDYFGFANRARARNYSGPGGTPEGRSLPWEMAYESFSITQTAVPEPSTFALIAGALVGCIALRRRS